MKSVQLNYEIISSLKSHIRYFLKRRCQSFLQFGIIICVFEYNISLFCTNLEKTSLKINIQVTT